MAILASDIFSEARTVFLNETDPGSLFPDSKLLAPLKRAYRDLQLELQKNGLQPILETSPAITVTALAKTPDSMPIDFLSPIALREKFIGDTHWTPMDEKEWEPDVDLDEWLKWWVFREDTVQFPGATVTKQVQIDYYKLLSVISGASSPILVVGSEGYLSAKTAAYASFFQGSNETRAAACNAAADQSLDAVIRANVKRKQATPVRRRLWRGAR